MRAELDCANSSDALLMNIFCYPRVTDRKDFCSLLGIDSGCRPIFGYKPAIPLMNGCGDQTEVDMSLGRLLVEAKLTESGFQSASEQKLLKYRDLQEVFELSDLPIAEGKVKSYQLIRGVLAAHHLDRSFIVLIDARRCDLKERWIQIIGAVRGCELRSRLGLLTWQEVAAVLPAAMQIFLRDKYSIFAAS